jgi:hypothetical protein
MSTFNYQGRLSTNYFEGWYVRILDETNRLNLAVIFAVTFYEKDPHAFIQVFDQAQNKNTYYRFDVDRFKTEGSLVKIQDNELSMHHLKLMTDNYQFNLTIKKHALLEKKSAMGFLEKFPLECYQEVLFLDALIQGDVIINDTAYKVDGHSYMEKTYGKNFPKKWFWLQASNPLDAFAFTLAGGRVPTLFFTKFGFFIIVKYQAKEYAFGSYNLARLKINKQGDHVFFTVKKGAYKIMISALSKNPVTLVGPSKGGFMNLDVYESIDSDFTIKFYHNKNLIYEGSFTKAGFEWMYEN